MAEPLLIAKGTDDLVLLPQMANRHGLIAGATGTGKTVTLQVMAEAFSRAGVPVFAADVKGDLSGISQAGASNPKLQERIKTLKLGDFPFFANPTTCWDVFGQQGHPVRATTSEMGPLLFSRLLSLNDTQAGVLTIVFKIADDHHLLLLDLKDLQAMLQHVGRSRARLPDAVWKHLGGKHRGDPARAVGSAATGRRQISGRAGAEPRRPDSDRRERPRCREHPGSGQAAAVADALRDVSAVADVGAVREAAGGGRSGEAKISVLLR